MYRTGIIALSIVAAVFAAAPQAFGEFAGGTLVVSRVGDGTAALSSAATAMFLDSYSVGGTNLGFTVNMPTTVSGANYAFTNSGSAASECQLSLSVNGQYLTLAGYNAAPGTAAVSGTTAADTARVVAIVGLDGTVNTSTALSDAYSTSNIRAAVTVNGSAVWTAGTAGSSDGGIHYALTGATTSTQVSPTSGTSNTRVINIFNNQLYVSAATATGPLFGVGTVGTGLPTSALSGTIAQLPGFPTATGPSSYDFLFADANTLYVADDRAIGSGGGLQKWTFDSSAWTLSYTLSAGLIANGVRSVTGCATETGYQLFAVTGDQDSGVTGEQNKLVSILDAGSGSSFSLLAAAPTNEAFRGVEYIPVPEPATLSLLAVCGLAILRRRSGQMLRRQESA
jgi:hypothetical protein